MYVNINRILTGLGLLAVSVLVVACHIGQPTPTITPSPTGSFVAQSSFGPDVEVASHSPVDILTLEEPQLPPDRERLSQLEDQHIYYITSLDTAQEGQSQLGIWRASLDNKGRVLVYSKVYSETTVWDGEVEDQLSYSWDRLTLSPDGQTLAFAEHSRRLYSRTGGYVSIWTLSVDGANPQKRATFGPSLVALELAWSPDSSQLGVVLETPLPSPRTVALVDLKTNSVTQYDLTSGFVFAPTGQDVVLSRSYAVDPGNADALGLYLITDDKAEEKLLSVESGDPLYPDWSPDGSEIAYSRDGIYSLNLSDRKIRQLATTAAVSPLKWSPNGQYIVFVDEKDSWLRVADREGNQIHAFVRGFAEDVQWSADSKAILASDTGPLDRYVIAFVADGATVIIPGKGAYSITW
jgi:WD40 repeat protein